MTQRLHSAGIVDQECLHVASPCGLGLLRAQLPQSSSSFYKLAQESRCIPEKKVDSVWPFLAQHHFCCTPFIEADISQSDSRARYLDAPSNISMKGDNCKLKRVTESSLAVQWLRFWASNTEDVGSTPGWGTKSPHSAGLSQRKKSYSVYCLLEFSGFLDQVPVSYSSVEWKAFCQI